MRVHYVYWMCLGVSVCERVGGCVREWEGVWVCECVSVWVCVQSNLVFRQVVGFQWWMGRGTGDWQRLSQLLSAIRQGRYEKIWSSLNVSWIFHLIAHREGRRKGGKRGGGGESEEWRGGDRVWCVCEVGSGKILAAELIRENIENSIRKKKKKPVPFSEFSKAILQWHSMP